MAQLRVAVCLDRTEWAVQVVQFLFYGTLPNYPCSLVCLTFKPNIQLRHFTHNGKVYIYYCNKPNLSSGLLYKNLKIKIYETIILSVVLKGIALMFEKNKNFGK